MSKVLVVATSRKTRGGITAVLKLYEKSRIWQQYKCCWIGTHRDGSLLCKLRYLFTAFVKYLLLLPFYDVVHIHFSLSNSAKRKYPFFRLAKAFRKKVIIHLHCGSQIDEIWSPIYQYMFEYTDYALVLSESLKQKIEDYIGENDKIKVVYNPCPIINRTNAYEKQKNILFSGTLYEGKGYKDLIRAFARIAEKYLDWRIVLAGNGEVNDAKSLAEELQITNQVVLLGWVNGEDKHRVFSESMVLCLPSYAEGFPMAVLDAWAYGLPVITTPVGGIPDIAEDGKNMLLFNPGDVDKLSECLERMITDEKLREDIGKESLKLAATTFNVNTICEQVGDLYESLLK